MNSATESLPRQRGLWEAGQVRKGQNEEDNISGMEEWRLVNSSVGIMDEQSQRDFPCQATQTRVSGQALGWDQKPGAAYQEEVYCL